MDLKVLQWNCRSVVPKKSDLIYMINKHKISIVALSETWLKSGFLFGIPGFTCLREDRTDDYAGVAILVKNTISFQRLSLPSHNLDDINVIGIKLSSGISIISTYIPHPSSDIFDNEIVPLITAIKSPFLLLGDFNSHHRSWGCGITDNNGNNFLDIIDQHNLCILNTGIPTRRTKPGEKASAVDLSICNPGLASAITWFRLNSTFGSDHFPLIMCTPMKTPGANYNPRLKHRLTQSETDWVKFKNIVHNKTKDFPNISQSGVTTCSEALAKCLIEAADETFPRKRASSGLIPSPPWWDHECTAVIKTRKEAEEIYKQDMSNDNYDQLCKVIDNTKKILKQKKRNGWISFCTSLSPTTCPSEVWRNIKRFRSAYSSSSFITLDPSLANSFMDQLAPPTVAESYDYIPFNSPLSESSLNDLFSLAELKGVLDSVKDSSPGEDGIPYSFFVNLNDESLSYYLKLVNEVIATGEIPLSWRTQVVIPILKPTKPSCDPKSFRPIALSPILCKLAEHLVKNRLEWFIESNQLLSNSQFGFRKGKSTIDSISILTSDIHIAFSKNKIVLAAFLDIHSAYDNVNVSNLIKKMKDLNVPEILTKFVNFMLSERHIHLDLPDGTRLTRVLGKGLPQGSVLSPLLYNIYASDLESSLNNIHILQYADDLLLYYVCQSPVDACRVLNFSLALLKQWLDKNGLELSTEKSSVVLFTRKRFVPDVRILYDRTLIERKDYVKFLGVMLDSRLTGIQHCEYVVNKCERVLNMMKCLSGVWWGAHPTSLKLIYNALIRSILEYGTFLLQGGNKGAFKKLDAIQHKALRLILGTMKSSPINAMQVECVEPPLSLRRQLLSDKFVFKAYQNSNHPLFPKLQILEELMSLNYWKHKPPISLSISYKKLLALEAPIYRSEVLPLFKINLDSLSLKPNICYNVGVNKNDIEANIVFNYNTDEHFREANFIFTDASKSSVSENVGVGVFHDQYNIVQKIKLPPEASVFTGECFGIDKALEYILLMKLNSTVIFTDSKSALQAIEKFPFKMKPCYPIICDIREKLWKCKFLNYSVTLAWIPSHQGISGNERADQLAKEAVECGDLHPFINYCHDLSCLPKSYLFDSWRHLIAKTSLAKGKVYFSIQPDIPKKPWFHQFECNKTIVSIITRMRLGHVCTPAHLARLHIVPSDLCDCGTDVGDLDHIFFSCPRYDHSLFLNSLAALNVPFPTRMSCLLMDPCKYYYVLASFINVNNIKI